MLAPASKRSFVIEVSPQPDQAMSAVYLSYTVNKRTWMAIYSLSWCCNGFHWKDVERCECVKRGFDSSMLAILVQKKSLAFRWCTQAITTPTKHLKCVASHLTRDFDINTSREGIPAQLLNHQWQLPIPAQSFFSPGSTRENIWCLDAMAVLKKKK